MKILTLSLCLAGAPAVSMAQGHCAVPNGATEQELVLPPVIRPVLTAKPLPASRSSDAPLTSLPGSLLDVGSIPVLEHLRENSGMVDSLGSEHGMATFVAHSPGHFMVVDVTPDQKAILTGLVMQVSLAELLSLSKGRVQELPPSHGLRAFFLRSGDRFQVFYATPDEQRVIPGMMWDEAGKNVTRQQIASIPGTKPQVQIELPVSSPTDAGVSPSNSLDAIKASYAGTYGRPGAPHAWMFVDPQCTFSIRALQTLQPFVDAGKIQLSVVPLSILDAEDHGLSTSRALAMVKERPEDMVPAWQRNTLDPAQSGTDDAKAGTRLQRNMQAARLISLAGTPTFVWQNRDGTMGRLDGVPQDVGAMILSMGS